MNPATHTGTSTGDKYRICIGTKSTRFSEPSAALMPRATSTGEAHVRPVTR